MEFPIKMAFLMGIPVYPRHRDCVRIIPWIMIQVAGVPMILQGIYIVQ